MRVCSIKNWSPQEKRVEFIDFENSKLEGAWRYRNICLRTFSLIYYYYSFLSAYIININPLLSHIDDDCLYVTGEETKLTTIESIQTHRGSVSPSTYLIASYYLAFVTVMGTSFNIVVIYVILTDIKVITENLTLRSS